MYEAGFREVPRVYTQLGREEEDTYQSRCESQYRHYTAE